MRVQRLGELQVWQPVFPKAFAGSDQLYAAQLHQSSQDFLKTWGELQTPGDLTRRAVWQQALSIEQGAYLEAHDQNMVSAKTLNRLSLMVNSKTDAILADQIPPPISTFEALEGPLEKKLLTMKQWLWSWGGRGQLQVDQLLREHYEFALAVALIGKRLAENVHQLGQQLAGQLDSAIFEACASWYASMSQEIFQRLKAQEDEHPKLFQAIQQRILKQAIQASARNRLEKLVSDGIVLPSPRNWWKRLNPIPAKISGFFIDEVNFQGGVQVDITLREGDDNAGSPEESVDFAARGRSGQVADP